MSSTWPRKTVFVFGNSTKKPIQKGELRLALSFLCEKNMRFPMVCAVHIGVLTVSGAKRWGKAVPKPKTVRAYFDDLEPHPSDIAIALENVIKTQWPHLTVKLAWGFPCWSGNERVFSVIAHADRCNLQLWQGSRLAEDYLERIEGTGKSLRHVKVFSIDDVNDELIDIMDRAVALDTTAPQRVR